MNPEDNPADDDPHGECRHEIERLQGYEAAYLIWQEKTQWVQDYNDWAFPALGMHRADVMKREIKRLTSELEMTANKLADVWIHLDAFARGEPFTSEMAASILRHQQAAGWKS